MKNLAKVVLDMISIEELQHLASELEYRIDRIIDGPDEQNQLMDPSWETREGIHHFIALIASLEKDLQKRIERLLSEYMEQIYALHVKLESDLEVLEQACNHLSREDSLF